MTDLEQLVAAFPLSQAGKAQLLGLYDRSRDPLAGRSTADKLALIKRTSYRAFLTQIWGCGEEVANCFQGRTLDFFGLGCDAVPAADVREFGVHDADELHLGAFIQSGAAIQIGRFQLRRGGGRGVRRLHRSCTHSIAGRNGNGRRLGRSKARCA